MPRNRKILQPEEWAGGPSDIEEYRGHRKSILTFQCWFVSTIWVAYLLVFIAVGRGYLPNIESTELASLTSLVKWITGIALVSMLASVFPNFKMPNLKSLR